MPGWLLLPLILVAVIVLLGLGFWQWDRYGDKQDLEAAYDARTDAPPLDLTAALALPPDEVDFHRMTLDGRWDTENILTIASRFRDSVRGEELVVPLVADDGTAILVDRGWYPLEEREAVMAALAESRTAHVEGLARWAEDGGGRETGEGAWNRFDPASMAAALPYPAEPWGVIEGAEMEDSTPPSRADSYPIGGWTRFQNTVPHFEYALTWWGLAAALVATAVARFVLRRGRQDADVGASSAAADAR